MKKTIYPLLAVVLVVGCKQQTKQLEVLTPKVEITEVKTIQTNGNLHYSGTIEATQTIPLTFQTAGTIKQILVDAGESVRKGQLLATVDNTDAQNMYDISFSKYKQAKDAYNRLKEVHDNGSLTDLKWVEMETNMAQAESSVALAKNNLDKCSLRSPDNGVIGTRNAEPGMSALMSLKAPLELVKIENVYVKIAVPENEIGKMRKGMKASFNVSALDNQTFEGTVNNVGVVANQMSRTYEVKILVQNSGLKLKPGMVCDVDLNYSSTREILAVPYQCVDKDNSGKQFVYVVDSVRKTVRKRMVTIGEYQNDNIEIFSGLNVGEKVVRVGKEKLSDNCKISL